MIQTPGRRRLGYEEELMRQVAAALALVLSMLAVAVAQQPAATAEPSVILPKELARVLTDFRQGQERATDSVMRSMVQGLSDADVQALAAYLGAQP